jgi:hypothetical protein
MAKKASGLIKELKRIEAEEEVIEKAEKRIEEEEERIEQKEDLLRVFEELGLMRWKSYYILTAGAILLLSLTFVAALWVMHDQVAAIDTKISSISVPAVQQPAQEWCPAGQSSAINMGEQGSSTIFVVGKEMRSGKEVCHMRVTSTTPEGTQTADMWIDQLGGVEANV